MNPNIKGDFEICISVPLNGKSQDKYIDIFLHPHQFYLKIKINLAIFLSKLVWRQHSVGAFNVFTLSKVFKTPEKKVFTDKTFYQLNC